MSGAGSAASVLVATSRVLGIAQRGGKVVAVKARDVAATTVMPVIRSHVLPRTNVYTDEFPSYRKLTADGYIHKRIHHASKVYVMGTTHTNTVEGFWSLLKRGINGVYHAVSGKYLQSYLDEYAFRYNHRNDEIPMFKTMLYRVKVCERGGTLA
jgi:transposase-like protein